MQGQAAGSGSVVKGYFFVVRESGFIIVFFVKVMSGMCIFKISQLTSKKNSTTI